MRVGIGLSEDAEQVGAVMAAGRGIHSGSHSVVIFVLLHQSANGCVCFRNGVAFPREK